MMLSGTLIRAEAQFTPDGLKLHVTLDVDSTELGALGAKSFEITNPAVLGQVEQIVASMLPTLEQSVGVSVKVREKAVQAEAAQVEAAPVAEEGGQ